MPASNIHIQRALIYIENIFQIIVKQTIQHPIPYQRGVKWGEEIYGRRVWSGFRIHLGREKKKEKRRV